MGNIYLIEKRDGSNNRYFALGECACGHFNIDHKENKCTVFRCYCQEFRLDDSKKYDDNIDNRMIREQIARLARKIPYSQSDIDRVGPRKRKNTRAMMTWKKPGEIIGRYKVIRPTRSKNYHMIYEAECLICGTIINKYVKEMGLSSLDRKGHCCHRAERERNEGQEN